MKKTILRTIATIVVAYGVYAVLVLAPAWLPSLPALPKLPLLDPQEILGGVGLLPTDVSSRLDDVRRNPEEFYREATARAEEVERYWERRAATRAAEAEAEAGKVGSVAENEGAKVKKEAEKEYRKRKKDIENTLGL